MIITDKQVVHKGRTLYMSVKASERKDVPGRNKSGGHGFEKDLEK